jgi:CheY-like chemotaxis protein
LEDRAPIARRIEIAVEALHELAVVANEHHPLANIHVFNRSHCRLPELSFQLNVATDCAREKGANCDGAAQPLMRQPVADGDSTRYSGIMASVPLAPLALVVDDAPTMRRRACSVIERELGWRTREAANACDALRALSEEPPAVVLTDLQMPDCNGLDLVDQIRSNHPSIPVVVITTVGSEKIALKALQRGAASYVPKSELAAELADSLERVVAAAQTTQNRRRLLSRLTRVELEFVFENDPCFIPVLVTQIQDHLRPKRPDPHWCGPGGGRPQRDVPWESRSRFETSAGG